MRSSREIAEQLEARFAEIEELGNSPRIQFQCRDCRHFEWQRGFEQRCINPLVQGFGRPPVIREGWGEFDLPELCGHEKALWEPRQADLPTGFWIVALLLAYVLTGGLIAALF